MTVGIIHQFETIAELEKAIKALENYDALVETVKSLVAAYQLQALDPARAKRLFVTADQFINNLEK